MDNPAIREFDEIRPYEPGEMRQAFDELINDRQFQLILKGVDFERLCTMVAKRFT